MLAEGQHYEIKRLSAKMYDEMIFPGTLPTCWYNRSEDSPQFKPILSILQILLFFFIPFVQPLSAHTGYSYNPAIPIELWTQLEPFFLPVQHPIKPKLDRIFKSQRVTLSKESFEKAGFGKVKERKPTNIVVGRNPSLEGYLIKAYLDTQPPLPEWMNWIARIEGAEAIRLCLKNHGFKQFKVPRKWIYPLPASPSPPLQAPYAPKYFILVVEDMRILSSKDNLRSYQKKMTREMLKAFYTILKEVGLIDSVYPDNVPFTVDGKLAFIDTEHHHNGPVKYEKLTKYFSRPMQNYWQTLISNDR